MATAVGDILQIEDYQSYLGQMLLNVYHFEVTEWGADTELTDVSTAFTTDIVGAVKGLQNVNLTHTRVVVKNLTNGIDIAEVPIAVSGTSVGDPAPSFEQLAFRLVRTTRDTRHGQKRVGGISDQASNGNTVVAGLTAAATAYGNAIANGIQIDAGSPIDFTAMPVIVGRFAQGTPNAGELNLAVINPVQAVSLIRLSTQATRRAGRGV